MVEVLTSYLNPCDQGERLRALVELVPSGPSEAIPQTPGRICRRLDEGKIAELVAAYEAGLPIKDIVERFQVDQRTIQKYVRRQGLPRRVRHLTAEEVEEAVQFYAEGRSVEFIANHLGVSSSAVRRRLSVAGVTLRPRGRPSR